MVAVVVAMWIAMATWWQVRNINDNTYNIRDTSPQHPWLLTQLPLDTSTTAGIRAGQGISRRADIGQIPPVIRLCINNKEEGVVVQVEMSLL